MGFYKNIIPNCWVGRAEVGDPDRKRFNLDPGSKKFGKMWKRYTLFLNFSKEIHRIFNFESGT